MFLIFSFLKGVERFTEVRFRLVSHALIYLSVVLKLAITAKIIMGYSSIYSVMQKVNKMVYSMLACTDADNILLQINSKIRQGN